MINNTRQYLETTLSSSSSDYIPAKNDQLSSLSIFSTEYQLTKSKNPDEPEPFPLSMDELDQIDEITEKLILGLETNKTQMTTKLQKTKEKIKDMLVDFLDYFFDQVEDLKDNHSKYSKFENLVSVFQDSKSDYEIEQSESNSRKLLSSIRALFNTGTSCTFSCLIDADNFDLKLEEVEKMFQKTVKLMKFGDVSHVFTEFMNQNKINEQTLFESLSSYPFDDISKVSHPQFEIENHPFLLEIKTKILNTAPKEVDEKKFEFDHEILSNFLNKNIDSTFVKKCFYLRTWYFLKVKKRIYFVPKTISTLHTYLIFLAYPKTKK